jgi:uncharacterized membrane protein YdbT with pleckstrin-like domain
MAILGKKPHQEVLNIETVVIFTRFHWVVMRWVLPQTIGIVIGAFLLHLLVSDLWLLNDVLWYLSIVVLARAFYFLAHWWDRVFIVTDRRFMIVSGVIENKVASMPTTKVTDFEFRQTWVGRLFGYGRLRIESAGQHQDLELINFFPRYEETKEAITKHIFGKGSPHTAKTNVRKLTAKEKKQAKTVPGTMDEVSQEYVAEGDDGT